MFEIFPLVGCPICPKPTSTISTNDGNRTQTCSECKLSFIKDGKLHENLVSILKPMKEEFDARHKSLYYKPKIKMPLDEQSDYLVFENPYLVCPDCDSKCNKIDPQPKLYSFLGWTYYNCIGCKANFIKTETNCFANHENSILLKIEKDKEIGSIIKPIYQFEELKHKETLFFQLPVKTKIEKMEQKNDYKVELVELMDNQYCTCLPGFRISIHITDKFGNSLCPNCHKVERRTPQSCKTLSTQFIDKIYNNQVEGFIEINCHCYESSPCQHYVSFYETNQKIRYELGSLDSISIQDIISKSNYVCGFKFSEEENRNYFKHFGISFYNRSSYASLQTYPVEKVYLLTIEGLERQIHNIELFMNETNFPLFTKPIEWFNAGVEMMNQFEKEGYFSYNLFKDVQCSEETIIKFIKRINELQYRIKFVSVQYLNNEENKFWIDINKLTNELNPYADKNSTNIIFENLKMLSLRANTFLSNTRIKQSALVDILKTIMNEFKELQSMAENIKGRWNKKETFETLQSFIKKCSDKIESLSVLEEKEQKNSNSSSLSKIEIQKRLDILTTELDKWVATGIKLKEEITQIKSLSFF
jgi:hypothetical protein